MNGVLFSPQNEKTESFDEGVISSLTANQRMTVEERFRIYHQDYWVRCLESLFEDFPTLVQLLGKSALESIFIEYLRYFPSKSFTLRHLGCDLSRYFREKELPFKTLYEEVAHFEYLLTEVFDAREEIPYHPESLSEEQREFLAEMPLQLQPYLRFMEAHYDLEYLRQSSIQDVPEPLISPELLEIKTRAFVIFRLEGQLHYRVLSVLAMRFFLLFLQPCSLMRACEIFMQQLSESEWVEFSSSIQIWMQQATTEQWFFLAEK